MNNVIYLSDYKKKLKNKKIKKRQGPGNLSHAIFVPEKNIYTEEEFDKEIQNLYSKFKTNSYKFKYPTILNQYRKGINPVSAIYESSQKAMLSERKNYIDKWVLELIKDKEFTNTIIDALINDIHLIRDFIQYYSTEIHFLNKLQLLFNKLKLFCHYLKVFKIFLS